MSIRWYLLLLSGAALLSCETRKPAAGSAAPPPVADTGVLPAAPRPRLLATADTVAPFPSLPTTPPDSLAGLPVVQLAGQPYRVETAVRVDLSRPLPMGNVVPASGLADSLTQALGYGYDAVYTIRVLGAADKPRFTTVLRKPDFAGAIGREAVAAYATSAPTLLAYLPGFNALAFEVGFFTEGTDDVSTALLLLDAATGRVRHVLPYEQWDDADGANALTTDGRALLTGSDLVRADGRHLSLQRPGQQVAGTRWLNDQTLLVAYVGAYDQQGSRRDLRGPNAHLLRLDGRELGAFRLDGLEAEVGYAWRAGYVRALRMHYLFDEEHQTLRQLPREGLQRHRLVPLQPFVPPQRPTEVRFTCYSVSNYAPAFYVDTLSGAVRYRPMRTIQ